ncbi:MAG: STAS/SEC14 domain-containing protein [Bacteroidota bacterium]
MYTSNSTDTEPLKEILQDNEDLLGFSIDNQPTKADYIFINNRLASYIEKATFFKILLQFKDHGVIAPAHIFEELKNLLVYYKKQTKIAALASSKIQNKILEGDLHMENTEIRCFDLEKQAVAIAWLSKDT